MNPTRVSGDTLGPSALPHTARDARASLDIKPAQQPPPSPQTTDSKPKDTEEDAGNGDKDAAAAAQDESSPLVTKSVDDAPPASDPQSVLLAKLLQFASTATPSTVGAIAVGLSAVLYLILGRLALLFIGAFGGALGFIAWEARHPEVARVVKGEKGLDVLQRLHLSAIDKAESKPDTSAEEEEELALKGLDELRPETREALGSLLDAVIRDYVKWWYSPMIPTDHSFPLTCRKTLTSYILAISNQLYRKRPADSFLDLLTNSSSMIIVFMSELAAAFTDVGPESDISAVEAVCNYRASHPDCHLNNLLNQQQQSAKFRMVSEDLLRFLDRSPNSGDPAWVFLREIIANFVLEGALQTCSKADWINGWIVYLLEAGEPDLNQAIDVGMQTGRDVAASANAAAAANKESSQNNNVFIDFDGNVGNIGLAKPGRSGSDARSKATQNHKKKLSKADEEMEVAVEEMKKLNAMIAQDEERRRERAATIRNSTDQAGPGPSHGSLENLAKSVPPSEPSPTSQIPPIKNSPPGSSTDGVSTTSEAIATPHTPRSINETASQGSSPRRSGGPQFTSFDQIQAPQGHETNGDGQDKKPPLTLHNASFTLHDDTVDKARIRNKPNWDYLIQVEPSSAAYPGWMIVRRYSDFETLHEILRRIAAVSGATAFTELHKELPAWKIHTRESLRGELERYLRDACWYLALAESEGMKRFLEKSQGHTHGDSKTFGWDTVGKNMLDVLTTAPKGAVEGGRTLVGGVQGVFGNFPGLAKRPTSSSVDLNATTSSNRLSISTPPRMESKSPARSDRASIDSQRSSVVSQQPGRMAPMERRTSYQSQAGDADSDYFRMGRTERLDSTASGPGSARPSREHSRTSSLAALRSPSSVSLENVKLPPPPDEIAEDYDFFRSDTLHKRTDSLATNPDKVGQGAAGPAGATAATPGSGPSVNGATSPIAAAGPGGAAAAAGKKATKPARQFAQLTEPETRVAVELLFAVINEMYTLSSAWNIRRTLLTAAKSFLLRPGNPSLLTVQSLIQTSVLDTYTSDAGIAAQLRKVRENTMPTDEERAAWAGDMTDEEREKLRVKARALLIRSGVPAALMGVMGQAATSEALGRVFDCLQIEEVARGLIFGLLLQLVRVITH